MKSIFFSLFLLSFICFSCGSSSDSAGNNYQDPAAKMHQEMHNEYTKEQALSKLDGKWLIKQVYDIEIDSTQFDGKQPLMTIDVNKEILSGNDGCNLFHGKVTVKTDTIVFGPTAGTLMACPHMELSTKIMTSFVEKELNYTLTDVLIFYKSDQQVMVLQRIE